MKQQILSDDARNKIRLIINGLSLFDAIKVNGKEYALAESTQGKGVIIAQVLYVYKDGGTDKEPILSDVDNGFSTLLMLANTITDYEVAILANNIGLNS